ncbi:hypothetical protein CMUS01_02529 [Colletotrichum musicola]|uniref:Uncharacterized protein n=1 Tax=Colletotrichum musicola TaxID=2175873 RepID=A0A8H6NV38_9PEZI|nr:hypothetical protein CMUS01_02529 [Colletotrichum musicola]
MESQISRCQARRRQADGGRRRSMCFHKEERPSKSHRVGSVPAPVVRKPAEEIPARPINIHPVARPQGHNATHPSNTPPPPLVGLVGALIAGQAGRMEFCEDRRVPLHPSPYGEVIPDEIVQRPALPSSAAERVPGKSRDTTSVRGIRAGATCIAPRQQGQERQTKAEVCWKMTSSPGVVSSGAGQRFRMGAGSRGREKWTRHPEDTEGEGWESRRGVVSAHQLTLSAPSDGSAAVMCSKPIEGGEGRLRQTARRVALSPGVRYTAFPPSLSSYSENILGSARIASFNAGPRFRGSKALLEHLENEHLGGALPTCDFGHVPSHRPPTAPEEIVSLCCRSAPGNLASASFLENPRRPGGGGVPVRSGPSAQFDAAVRGTNKTTGTDELSHLLPLQRHLKPNIRHGARSCATSSTGITSLGVRLEGSIVPPVFRFARPAVTEPEPQGVRGDMARRRWAFPGLGGLHFAVHSAWSPIRHGDCAQGACSESSEPSAPGGWANPGAADFRPPQRPTL